MGSLASVSTSNAFSSLPAPSAKAGAAPPALEVEKNTGLMSAKSPSSCMRCIRTEPTMPRQPTSPTNFIACPLNVNYLLQGCAYRVAHLFRTHLRGALLENIGRPQALRQHALDRCFDAVGLFNAAQRKA